MKRRVLTVWTNLWKPAMSQHGVHGTGFVENHCENVLDLGLRLDIYVGSWPWVQRQRTTEGIWFRKGNQPHIFQKGMWWNEKILWIGLNFQWRTFEDKYVLKNARAHLDGNGNGVQLFLMQSSHHFTQETGRYLLRQGKRQILLLLKCSEQYI